MSLTGEQQLVQGITTRKKLQAYWFFIRLLRQANPALATFRFILLIAGAIAQPLEVYFFAQLIGAIGQQDTSHATQLLTLVIATYATRKLVIDLTYSKINDWFSRGGGLYSQRRIMEHIATLDPEILLRDDVRSSLDYVREDLWRLNNLPEQTEWLVRSVFRFIGSFGLALIAPWWVTVLGLADAAIQAWFAGVESKNDLWTSTWNSLEGRQVEYIRYIFLQGPEFREVRLLGAERSFIQRLTRAGKRILTKFRSAAMASARNRVLVSSFNALTYGIVIVILGRDAFAHPSQLAILYTAISLFGLLSDALSGISGAFGKLYADLGILSRMHDLFALAPESVSGQSIPRAPLVIEFHDVSFRYPNATHTALSHVTTTIREGEHIAIVGENGAGKSTFLNLLTGLIQPTSGTILVNGIPLHIYKKREWRNAFHIMMQGAIMYQDFIRDNLTYGQSATTVRKSLQQSLHVAGADAVIRDVPEGLDTFIGDWAAPPGVRAHRVSGGQQQRLLIARTLIHGGRIIGFDEPTSAMDAKAEASFFERLHDTMKDRGLIFISHRFSTVRRASRILVFQKGKLSHEGSHEELLKQPGSYAELYTEQARWYTE